MTWLFSWVELLKWCNKRENAAIHVKEWRVLIWQYFSLLFTHLVSAFIRPFNSKKDKALHQIIKTCCAFQNKILAKLLLLEFTYVNHIQHIPPGLALLFPCTQENARSNSKEASWRHGHDAYRQQYIILNHTGCYSRVEKNKTNSGITPVRLIFLLLLLTPFHHFEICTKWNLCSTLPLEGVTGHLSALLQTLPNIPHDVLNIGRISKFCFIASSFLNISTYKRILIVSDSMKKNYEM